MVSGKNFPTVTTLQSSHSKVSLEKGALICQKTTDSIGVYEAGYSAPHITRYSLLKIILLAIHFCKFTLVVITVCKCEVRSVVEKTKHV